MADFQVQGSDLAVIERRIRSHTERLMKLTADLEDRTDAQGDAWRDLNDALNERFALESDLRFGPGIVPEQETARVEALRAEGRS